MIVGVLSSELRSLLLCEFLFRVNGGAGVHSYYAFGSNVIPTKYSTV